MARFDANVMNKLLRQFGDKKGTPNASFYFSRLCSCVGKTGRADPTCTACILGFIYDAVPTEELIIRTNMNLRMLSDRLITILQGGCNVTIPKKRLDGSDCVAYKKTSRGDVIVMKDDIKRDRDICELGVKDFLYAFDVKEILSVSEKNKNFVLNVDYEIQYTRSKTQIIWLNNDKPEQYYSVEFTSASNYLVWDDSAKIRGPQDDLMPKRIVCRVRPYFDLNINELMNVNTNFESSFVEGQQ